MNDKYKINDEREYSSFTKETFSGYKKLDVINTLLKSLEANKIENACNWITECIVSGYSMQVWEKLYCFSFKVVSINNPKLPQYMYKKHVILHNQMNHLKSFKKEANIIIRNSQMIRNLFFDVITTISTSLKRKRYDTLPKINVKDDFNFDKVRAKLLSQMNILPDKLIHDDDPAELRIILNEIFTMCKNKDFGYDKCCYWILWLLKWEAVHKKNKDKLVIGQRNIQGVSPKHGCDLIWPLWIIVFEEVSNRSNIMLKNQVSCLFQLFKSEYSPGKRKARLPLIFCAFAYLTNSIDYNLPIRRSYQIYIQSQSNVNLMFCKKKLHEKKSIVPKKEKQILPKNKKIKIEEIEIIQDKLSIFNEIDSLFTS